MDLAMGAMGSLLGILTEVIKKEYKLQKGVHKKVKSFSTELIIMQNALRKVAEVPWDQLDDQVKLWAADVRELSYDMEDVVDSLLVRVDCCDPNDNQGSLKKIMSKMANLFKKGKDRREISTAVNEIHARLQDVTRRHQMFNFPNIPVAKKNVHIDPYMEVFYGDKKNIIGLEKARDDIIKKIGEGGGVSKDKLKILSIVGFGGLGKTTLAREVYDAHASTFKHKAFVCVSRNPDIKRVLSDLLFKLGDRRDTANLNEEKLIILIRELLGKERYFIIIDDLWNEKAWETIRYALIDHQCGSIIITTTRHVKVSKICCSSQDDMIHKMKYLSDNDSKKLFYRRIFSSEVCPTRFEEVSKEILKKCAGVPLAITSLAGYLGCNQEIKEIGQWYDLLKTIGLGLTKGANHVEEMKRILSWSFYDLPSHLKTCFLYLSIFPEDHQINRDRLIRRWICEGFIEAKDETSLTEVGENYFTELVNRNMIEPINIHVDRSIEACRIHDIMLDLICQVSSENNFVTILDLIRGDTPLEENFRRLSLQKSMTNLTNTQMTTTSMPKVRSFTAFSPAISKIPPLSIFKILRVLDLEGCNLGNSSGVDLRHVENLLHLRYLGLRGTKVGKLLIDLGKLKFLQTLDLQRTNSNELPSSVVQMGHLMFLILDLDMPLPKGFQNLTCLEQLVGHGEGIFSADSAEELGHLISLRQLAFQSDQRRTAWYFLWPNEMRTDKPLANYMQREYRDNEALIESLANKLRTDKSLIKSLGKLHNLESLEISPATESITYLMLDWVPPPNLCRLKFGGTFKLLPTWICSSSLPLLSYLDLSMKDMRSGDIQMLGTLPALHYLSVETDHAGFSQEMVVEKVVFSADAFPLARVCLFRKVLLLHPTFQPGAMPMIQRLRFGLENDDNTDFDLSIRNLPSLQQLRIDLRPYTPNSKSVDALRRVAEDHPRSPTLHIDDYSHAR